MLITHQNPFNRSLTISVLGIPNVGKSSLINHVSGNPLSIITSKPQTTRHRLLNIAHFDRVELIFQDTPGLHQDARELNRRMNHQAREVLSSDGLFMLIIDVSKDWLKQVKVVEQLLGEKVDSERVWIVFNKIDLIPAEKLENVKRLGKQFQDLCQKLFWVSAKENLGMDKLRESLLARAPEGVHRYTDGSITNKNERFFVEEYVRKEAMELLKDELPYELAVQVESFQDQYSDWDKNNPIESTIMALIYVNRPSQRAIVICKQGQMIIEIGTRARLKLQDFLDRPINLNLHVKVVPNWFKNNQILETLGLQRAPDSTRVYRQKEWTQEVNHESRV